MIRTRIIQQNPHERVVRARLAIPRHHALRDCLFLSLAVLLSCILYVGGLGFYSDDWGFLMLLSTSNDQSFSGLVQALYWGDIVIRQRPPQVIYLAALYWLFGTHPLGFHLSNGFVLASCASLLYLVVRELAQPRLLAVSVALVYVLLPHYSTDRFWIAAFQATLSVALYLLSLYTDLRAVGAGRGAAFGWKAVSLLSLVGSILAYEVTLPLFLLLNPVLLWYHMHQLGPLDYRRTAAWTYAGVLVAANVLAIVAVILFKLNVSVRIVTELDYRMHIVNLVAGSSRVNLGTYGLGLPYIVWWILRNVPDWRILGLGAVFSLMVFGYLYSIADLPAADQPSSAFWLTLAMLGLFIFGLGYAIFLTSTDVWFTSTSLGNRIAIAAALGVALVFVACVGWLGARMRSFRHRAAVFCLLITSLCACGYIINNTLAAFWVAAYREQQGLVRDIRQQFPALPSGTTLILDGVCLERGGAYIFTGKRDLTGVLVMQYHDRSLRGTVISHTPRIEEDRLIIETYGSADFAYSDRLLVYNPVNREIVALTDAQITHNYFENTSFIPERDCPPGFAWNWNTRALSSK